jgi:L-threonylcarbamoyladenylate synthase
MSAAPGCGAYDRFMMPDPARIEKAVALLHAGELVAFPTETVYGLGADARNPAAVARIFAAKGRPASHPLIVHVSGLAAAQEWIADLPDTARRLADAFWPGPLTLVLPKAADVLAAVTGGQPTVALRAPAHPVARAARRIRRRDRCAFRQPVRSHQPDPCCRRA